MSGQHIAFIGGGNMGRALIAGLLARGASPADLAVPDSPEPTRTALQADFAIATARLEARLTACRSELSTVLCHGDCHGGNTHVFDGPDGERVAGFFDFDEAGPGCLSYELAVYPWYLLRRLDGCELDDAGRTRWLSFLLGYRDVRPIPSADLKAIALFIPIRQIWFLGEYVSRLPEWGTSVVSPSWLRAQCDLLMNWEHVDIPVA